MSKYNKNITDYAITQRCRHFHKLDIISLPTIRESDNNHKSIKRISGFNK